MTLDKSDQDTSLNVREGVQILQRRMRFQRWRLIHIDFPHRMLQVERQILSRYTSDHFIAQCHYLLYWNTIHLRFYPARLGTVMRIMRGANHDRPMMMAGPTPNRDINPVARGRPTISSMVEKIYSKGYHIQTKPSLPMTVETAAKF